MVDRATMQAADVEQAKLDSWVNYLMIGVLLAFIAIAQTAIPYLAWQVLAGVLTGATVLGLGASELPARTALRRDPVEVIGAQA